MFKNVFKKAKGDHSILSALLMMVVAIILAALVMAFVHSTSAQNADNFTNRTAKTMHSDGNRIYNYTD